MKPELRTATILKIWALSRLIEYVSAVVYAFFFWDTSNLVEAAFYVSGAFFFWYVLFLYAPLTAVIVWWCMGNGSSRYRTAVVFAATCGGHAALTMYLFYPYVFRNFPNGKYWDEWLFLCVVNLLIGAAIDTRVRRSQPASTEG